MIFKGRPVIKTECGDKNWVFVGRIPFEFTGKTFHDFLIQFLKVKLGYKWLQEQSELPDDQKHIILHWFKELSDLKQNAKSNEPGLFKANLNGSGFALLKLAYYLFLVGNNAHLEQIMLTRLRDNKLFYGAMYELFVFSIFVYAGYNIKMENEQDVTTQHPEFIATHRKTGNKYSVEAKLRIHKNIDAINNINIWTQLTKALKKQLEYPKIIFIDTNYPLASEKEMHLLFDNIESQINKKEQDPKHNDEAFIFITNNPYHFRCFSLHEESSVLIRGFRKHDYNLLFKPVSNSNEFIKFLELREKHQDLLDIHEAFSKAFTIPDHFGGDIEDNVYKILPIKNYCINKPYEIIIQGTKIAAILTDYIIDEINEDLYLILKNNNQTFVNVEKISAKDITQHKAAQEKLIEAQENNGIKKTLLQIYDWLYSIYANTSKEKLIEFLEPIHNKKDLTSKSQKELVRMYCATLAQSMYFTNLNPK